jgi:hypothetical protein
MSNRTVFEITVLLQGNTLSKFLDLSNLLQSAFPTDIIGMDLWDDHTKSSIRCYNYDAIKRIVAGKGYQVISIQNHTTMAFYPINRKGKRAKKR